MSSSHPLTALSPIHLRGWTPPTGTLGRRCWRSGGKSLIFGFISLIKSSTSSHRHFHTALNSLWSESTRDAGVRFPPPLACKHRSRVRTQVLTRRHSTEHSSPGCLTCFSGFSKQGCSLGTLNKTLLVILLKASSRQIFRGSDPVSLQSGQSFEFRPLFQAPLLSTLTLRKEMKGEECRSYLSHAVVREKENFNGNVSTRRGVGGGGGGGMKKNVCKLNLHR